MADVVEVGDAAGGTGTTYTLGLGQTARGTIASGLDKDWYAVTLTAGQTYTFALVGTGLSTQHLHDPYLTLRNASGVELTADDDNGPGINSSFTFTATTTGTYFLAAAGFNSFSTGQYTLSATTGSKAYFDADMAVGSLLLGDASWSNPGTAATVTYGFRQTTNGKSPNFSQLTAQQIAAVRTSLQLYSEIANVTFTEVNPGGYTNSATMLFSNYNDPNDGAGAYAWFPGSTAAGDVSGDVWLNTQSVSTTSLAHGSYSFFALTHEIGHALGLSHPGDYNAGPGQVITYASHAQFTHDSNQYSVMSYFDESVTGANHGGYADALMLYDILALQTLYGANTTTRTGDTVYGFSSTAGALYDFTSNATPAFCIWDAGGADTLNASGFSQAQVISLVAGTFSNIGGLVGNVSIAFGATVENATGGSGADTITGNASANSLIGNNGADSLAGGAGSDTLSGGVGNDTLDGGSNDAVGDTATFADASGSGVTVSLAVVGGQAVGGGRGTDTLIGIENLIGSGLADTLTGDTFGNALSGGAGVDTIFGGAGNDNISGDGGADIMHGGSGDDRFVVDTYAGEAVVELLGEGTDTVYAYIDYTLGLNIEQIILVEGSAAVNAGGGEDGNVIIGNSAANTIYGYGGNDVISGGGGADSLLGMDGNDAIDGQGGNDQMIGGLGDDLFVIDSISDVAAEFFGEGIDTVYADIDYTLGGNIEQLILREGSAAVNGAGDADNNVIIGNSAVNTIYGNDGADTLYGFANNDVLVGGNGQDIIDSGAGNDNLSGNADADQFKFAAGDGLDIVTDFSGAQGDQLVISTALAANFAAFVAAGTTVNGNAVYTFGGGAQTITLAGVTHTSLVAADVLFF